MKLLLISGHNWWVVMPNFVVQEPSLEEHPGHPYVRGPIDELHPLHKHRKHEKLGG